MPLTSMTGYAQIVDDSGLVVEIRTVNHKHLDIRVRLPKRWSSEEAAVKKAVSRHLHRGRVEVGISLDGAGGNGAPVVDEAQARRYLEWASKQTDQAIDPTRILALPGVVVSAEQCVDEDAVTARLMPCLTRACEAVMQMRGREGDALHTDLSDRLVQVADGIARIARRKPQAVAEIHGRLQKRVTALLDDAAIDPDRLAQEVALLADRADVTEELTRLQSHLEQFTRALSSDEPVGRTLDFLLVEFNREINTIGSKCQDATIAAEVVWLKGEIEKLREQVQNVE